MTNDPLNQLASDLESDPEIQAAHQEFENSCEVSEEDCWACSAKRAIHTLSHMDHDDPNELAFMFVDGLESALDTIAAAQNAINFLSDLTREVTSIIHYYEFHGDEEE